MSPVVADPAGLVALACGAYLLGAIPWGVWVVRMARGVDLRTAGSGNIGATNVHRVAGPWWAALVLALDVGKGALPVLAGQRLGVADTGVVCLGAAAILGHSGSVFLRLRGGKAVATGLGVFAALEPLAAVGALVVFALIVVPTRTVSAAALPAAWSLPLWLGALKAPDLHLALGVVAAGWITWRHRANLRRLAAGEEPTL